MGLVNFVGALLVLNLAAMGDSTHKVASTLYSLTSSVGNKMSNIGNGGSTGTLANSKYFLFLEKYS